MTFQEKRFHISGGNLLFLRWNFIFPPLEILFSTVGNLLFLRWNSKVPPLELKSSSAGTKKFLPWN